jgi:hypothetical protein
MCEKANAGSHQSSKQFRLSSDDLEGLAGTPVFFTRSFPCIQTRSQPHSGASTNLREPVQDLEGLQ